MSELNPVFWGFDGAVKQLSGTENTLGTIGWYLGNDETTPKGWVLCRELYSYKSIEIECCGFDDNGAFAAEHKLGALFDKICDYARTKGFLTLRTNMGSQQFSIHNRGLGDIAGEVHNLSHADRIDFDWLLGYGFKVIGIWPNAYGDNFHCIMLSKDLM